MSHVNITRVRSEVMRVVALYKQHCAEGDYSDGDGPDSFHSTFVLWCLIPSLATTSSVG